MVYTVYFNNTVATNNVLRDVAHLFMHFTHGQADVIASAITSKLFFGVTATSRCVSVVLADGVFGSVCGHNKCRDHLLDHAARSTIAIASILIP